ncbi:unnamed protein product, partial [Prorocentrum cordatum]
MVGRGREKGEEEEEEEDEELGNGYKGATTLNMHQASSKRVRGGQNPPRAAQPAGGALALEARATPPLPESGSQKVTGLAEGRPQSPSKHTHPRPTWTQ